MNADELEELIKKLLAKGITILVLVAGPAGQLTGVTPGDVASPPAIAQPDQPRSGTGSDPGASEPGASEPGASDPGASDPGASDPGASDPGASEPGASDPGGSGEDTAPTAPGTGERSGTAPGSPGTATPPGTGTTPGTPSTGDPSTAVPSTAVPSTGAPSTGTTPGTPSTGTGTVPGQQAPQGGTGTPAPGTTATPRGGGVPSIPPTGTWSEEKSGGAGQAAQPGTSGAGDGGPGAGTGGTGSDGAGPDGVGPDGGGSDGAGSGGGDVGETRQGSGGNDAPGTAPGAGTGTGGSDRGDSSNGEAGNGEAGADGTSPRSAPGAGGNGTGQGTGGTGAGPGAGSTDDGSENGNRSPATGGGAGVSPGQGTTAADALGWGNPVRADDFTQGSEGWSIYDGAGHAGNGRRTPDAVSVSDGILTITGDSEGSTAGMAWNPGQKYGRWEGRVKAPASDPSYNALLLLWPDAEDFPEGGEVDFMEMMDDTRQKTNLFLHHGADNSQVSGDVEIDATQWHNWAVEWTPDHVAAFVDGEQWWKTTDTSILPPGPMHLCIQLDWFPKGGDVKESTMQVDWVKQYAIDGASSGGGGGSGDENGTDEKPAAGAGGEKENG